MAPDLNHLSGGVSHRYSPPCVEVIAVTKSHIFSSAVHESIPNINGLKNKLQKQYEDQHHLNIEVNKVDQFTFGILIEAYSVSDIQTVYIL